jgi:hypothetical protein
MIFEEADVEPRESTTGAPAGQQKSPLAEESGRPLILLEQERRQLMVRDINSKLGDLESNVSRLTAAFGQSQQTINNTLLDIQRRSTRMTADILGLVSRADRDSEQQSAATTALDRRLKAGLTELREQLNQAASALRNQHGRLDQMESGQKTLLKLHDGLAVMSRQQGDAIQGLTQENRQQGRQLQSLGAESRLHAEALQVLGSDSLQHGEAIKALDAGARVQGDALRALTSEAREQLQVNRTHINGLQALYREQKQGLQALVADFDLLADRTNLLTEQLQGLGTEVAQERLWVRKGFKIAGGALAGLVVVMFAVMAYMQWHPVTVPDAVRAELTGLSSQVSKQTAAQQAMAADLQAMQTHIAALGASSDTQSAQIALIQKQVQRSLGVLHRVRKSEAGIQHEVGGLEARMDKVEQVQAAHPAG